jgi:hypothetical protein
MERFSKDVTAATNPAMPPTHNVNMPGAVPEQSPTPSRQLPVEPTRVVSGASAQSIKSADRPARDFTLPDSVSAKEIQAGSFKYGGGRSAGSTKP